MNDECIVPVAVDKCPGSIKRDENISSFVVIDDAAFKDETISVECTISSSVVTDFPTSVSNSSVPVEMVEAANVELTIRIFVIVECPVIDSNCIEPVEMVDAANVE